MATEDRLHGLGLFGIFSLFSFFVLFVWRERQQTHGGGEDIGRVEEREEYDQKILYKKLKPIEKKS